MQTCGVDEIHKLDLPNLRFVCLARKLHAYRAIISYADSHCAFWDSDLGQKIVAISIDDIALAVFGEFAISRVGCRAIGHLDLEKALATNGYIKVVRACVFVRTLVKYLCYRCWAHAKPYLDACGVRGSG